MSASGGDIWIVWSNDYGIGDWAIDPASGDLLTGNDLATSVLVSLFTDRRAGDDFQPTDGTTDRRGWWADYYEDQPLGSLLWTLDRAKKNRSTLGLARSYALAALAWLLDDGVARTVEVDTRWVTPTMLGIVVTITQPSGAMSRFAYGRAWDGIVALASPVTIGAALPAAARLQVAR